MSASPCIQCLEPFPCRSAKLRVFRREKAFSLVEVSMALGVIAIAFIAMMGMLPVGMSVFRDSKDSTNENWISQVLQAKVLATDWKKLMPGVNDSDGTIDDLRSVYDQEEYYYDDEGRFVKKDGGTDSTTNFELANADFTKTYRVKILNGLFKRPETGNAQVSVPNARLFAVLLVNVNNKAAVESYENTTTIAEAVEVDDRTNTPKLNRGVKVRTFIVTKMDSSLDF